MDSIIDLLASQEAWEVFLSDRLMKGRFNWTAFDEADTFVGTEAYKPLAEKMLAEGPGIPEKKLINKMGTGRKRVVYTYPPDTMRMLKFIAFLLYRYDDRLPPNCYSFRRYKTPHDAVRHIVKSLGGKQMWAYKLDIHDYFNSIPIPLLLPVLEDFLHDDRPLFEFFRNMLSDDRALVDGTVVRESRGIMAGTPTAPFLADIYLAEADRYFESKGVLYARYSDDIILFAPDEGSLEEHKRALLGFLDKYGLEVNPDKERTYGPGEAFDFLGFKCLDGRIDIADSTKRKMKGKISRKARSLMRARSIRGLGAEAAMASLIRHFNFKFFETEEDPDSLNWTRWFFPLINSVDGLREIDNYFQQNLRYLSTGKLSKANYRIRYVTLKRLDYRSLMHEYYLFKEHNDK